MASAVAPKDQKTSGKIDVTIDLPYYWIGLVFLGGGLLVFMVVTKLLKKFDK